MHVLAGSAPDVPELARLMADSPLLRRYRVTLEGATAALSEALKEGDATLLARATSGALLGFAWLSFAPRVLDGAAYLRLLLVQQQSQHAGIGALLLQAAEQSSRARARHLYLLATTDNVGARRFYERHGYRHVGDLPGLVWPELDEALYYKTL